MDKKQKKEPGIKEWAIILGGCFAFASVRAGFVS